VNLTRGAMSEANCQGRVLVRFRAHCRSLVAVIATCSSLPCFGQKSMSVSIAVPVDHFDAHSPILPLTYELGASLDAKKPTVIVVDDGQQFYGPTRTHG
jgi:hypothetical protein